MLAFLGFKVMGLVSGLYLANHSDSQGPSWGAHIAQPRWVPVRRTLERLAGCMAPPLTFPELSSSWWQLISSMFFRPPIVK